jgi:ABC-2 type transport system ATP-binding protein
VKSKIRDNEKKVIISVKDLHKTFKLPQEKHTSVKQIFVSVLKKKHYIEQKVLSGISFDVHEGDFFGIIGRNGSGKSTLLKILAGIYVPDSGSIEINGRISPFLELGVGFNPELSGYENVYLNGALLGLSRKEIRDKMDEIIEFSELKDFMDQKLKITQAECR